ncbi:MAG: deoxyribonuclease IV [Nitrospirota bacterium]
MRRLGVHTSIVGGLHKSLERAKALECKTVQIFSHNPRGWAMRSISEKEISNFKSLRLGLDISPVYVHASYLINIASRNDNLRNRSVEMLIVEMYRADAIGADYVILHPGSASGDDEKISMNRAIDSLNRVAMFSQWEAGLLIENTAGERGDISSTITGLSHIINGVKGSLIAGICIDTCHAFAAGYDIKTDKGIKGISDEIKKHIGLEKVKLIHLNDSRGKVGSGIDRHEHIGLGEIGMRGLREFINFRPFINIPLILETPKKSEFDDPMNLKRVRRMIKEKDSS